MEVSGNDAVHIAKIQAAVQIVLHDRNWTTTALESAATAYLLNELKMPTGATS